MKKIILLLLSTCVILSGCGTQEKKVPAEEQKSETKVEEKSEEVEVKELEITQQGYSVDTEYGTYLVYGYTIFNPNEKGFLDAPDVTVTAKSADGSVLGTNTDGAFYLGANESMSFTGTFEITEEPATVDFVGSSKGLLKSEPAMSYPPSSVLEVTNISELPGEYDTRYTGEVTNTGDEDMEGVEIVVLLKQDGKIVYGTSGYLDSNLPAGKTMPFEVSLFTNHDHTEYEITANYAY